MYEIGVMYLPPWGHEVWPTGGPLRSTLEQMMWFWLDILITWILSSALNSRWKYVRVYHVVRLAPKRLAYEIRHTHTTHPQIWEVHFRPQRPPSTTTNVNLKINSWNPVKMASMYSTPMRSCCSAAHPNFGFPLSIIPLPLLSSPLTFQPPRSYIFIC